jgi:hypothetical protein
MEKTYNRLMENVSKGKNNFFLLLEQIKYAYYSNKRRERYVQKNIQ